MQYSTKNTGRIASMPKGIAAGVAAALLMTCIGGAILAFLISREIVSQESMGYWIMAILFVSSAISGWLSYRKIRHRRMLVYALSAAVFLTSLACITALFFGGKFEGFLPTTVLIFGGSGTALFLSAATQHPGKSKKIPKQFR